MKIRAIAAAALLAASLVPAASQPLSYARTSRDIRAGVLLVNSQRNPLPNGPLVNGAPHVWSALDGDVAVKPANWTFVNPLGQTTLTASMASRWTGDPSLPATGTRLTKRHAAYWEVELSSTSDSALARFDILLLNLTTAVSLRADERERIRRYVDQGGILWVDVLNGVADPANGLPLSFETAIGPFGVSANLSHPLLSDPNLVSLDELNQIRSGNNTLTRPVLSLPGSLNTVLGSVRPDGDKLEGISGNGSGFALSAGQIGNGVMVVSSFGLSRVVSRGITGPGSAVPNTSFRSTEIIRDGLYNAGAKLVFNLLSLGSSYGLSGGGSRKTSSIRYDVPAPLLQRWRDEDLTSPSDPVIFKGYTLVANGSTLRCYDSTVGGDIDGNGNPDDGVPNAPGSPDLVWQVNGGAAISSPLAVEVPNTVLPSPSNRALNQVWYTTASGQIRVHALETGALLSTIAPAGGTDTAVGPFPPTAHEGLVIVAEGRSTGFGRLRAIDMATASPLESTGDAFILEGTSRIDIPSAAPTVGYIPIFDNSGGLDRVVYLATKAGGMTPGPAAITSVWLGARGESPARLSRAGSIVTLSTRASLQGLPVFLPGQSPYGVRISLIRPDTGAPMTSADLSANLTGAVTAGANNGEVNVVLNAGANPAWDWDGTSTPSDPSDDVGWRIDYTIDWGRAVSNNPNSDNYVRGNLQLPDNTSNLRRIVGSPALTDQGNVILASTYVQAGRATPNTNEGGSSIFTLREEGRGDFVLLNRFDLYDQTQLTFNVNQTVNYRETIIDQDTLLSVLPGFLNTPILDLRVSAPPAVVGDQVFLQAVGFKSLGFAFSPTTVLLSLDANPQPVQMLVDGLQEEEGSNFSIVQQDPARSVAKGNPEQVSVLPRTSFKIEQSETPGTYKVTIPSLSLETRGTMRNAISTSLPIIFRRSNDASDFVVEPEAVVAGINTRPGRASGRWNPVNWFYVANGYRGTAGPVAAGRTMYVGGGSFLPSIIVSGLGGLRENAQLFAFDTEVASNDPFLGANTIKPWFSQLNTIQRNGPSLFDIRPADAIQWPQFDGIQSLDDLRVRILQSTVSEQRFSHIAVGEDSLAAVSTGGGEALNTFGRADFLVVDSQRAARFDAAGNPLWSLQGTGAQGREAPVGSASLVRPLTEPTRAYADANGSVWVVDSGANRVMQVDRSGTEIRTISRLRVHPTASVNGFAAGDSAQLSGPRDMLTYFRRYSAAEVAAVFPGEALQETATNELWRHVLIADTGNRRAVELVDRYRLDANGRVGSVVRYNNGTAFEPALGVLIWHSPEELSGGVYAYNSIARVADPSNPGRRITAFGFGITEPTRGAVGLDSPNADTGGSTGFGGVVIYDGPNTLVLNEFVRPALPDNAFLQLNTTSGRYEFASSAEDSRPQKIIGLQSVTLRRVVVGGTPRLAVMISEATGVYELFLDTSGPDPAWAVSWMLPAEAYQFMRRTTTVNPASGYAEADLRNNPLQLRAMHARRLENGDVLVVNGYSGRRFGVGGASFTGEVFVVEGRPGDTDIQGFSLGLPNLGFNSLSVKYELPPVAGVRELIRPVFADRQ